MINEKLAQHLANKLWMSKDRILEVLREYEEPQTTGIEAVNAKYPNGWYCEAFEEVISDFKKVVNISNFKYDNRYMGWDKYDGCWNSSDKDRFLTEITRSEYLQLTRGIEPSNEEWKPTKGEQVEVSGNDYNWVVEIFDHYKYGYYYTNNMIGYRNIRPLQPQPTKKNLDIEEHKQRDWTGVRFKRCDDNTEDFIIGKDDDGWICNRFKKNKYFRYSYEKIDKYFSDGTWIELTTEETPTIHTQLPNDLESRVKRIEGRLNIVDHA